jgi:hypothetical protein
VSDSVTDFYHQKTDAELQFFCAHPELYQANLIDMAWRELKRRQAQAPPVPAAVQEAPATASEPVPLAPPPTAYEPPVYVPAPDRTGLKRAALGLGLLVLGGGIYWLKKTNDNALAVVQERAEAEKHRAPARLVEEKTSAIPSYDVAGIVTKQLARVPASERADAKDLRQYRELAKRFWDAETQTEYLTNQAHAGQAGPMFADQALVARQTWSAWNKAAVYSYKFGPVMTRHLSRMSDVASSQQHILDQLPGLLPKRRFLNDREIVAREADVQDLLKDLLPTSPVTGKPYKATVLTIKF